MTARMTNALRATVGSGAAEGAVGIRSFRVTPVATVRAGRACVNSGDPYRASQAKGSPGRSAVVEGLVDAGFEPKGPRRVPGRVAMKLNAWLAGLAAVAWAGLAQAGSVGFEMASAPVPGDKPLALTIWYPTD